MSYLDVYAERGRVQVDGWDGRLGTNAAVTAVKDAYSITSHVGGEWHRPVVEVVTSAHITENGPAVLWLEIPTGNDGYRRIREAFHDCGLLQTGTGIDEAAATGTDGERRELHAHHSTLTRDDSRFWETFKVLAADSVLGFDALLETTRELVPVQHRQGRVGDEGLWPLPIRGDVLVSPDDPREDSGEVLLLGECCEEGPYRSLLAALKEERVSAATKRGGRPETAAVAHRMGAELPPF